MNPPLSRRGISDKDLAFLVKLIAGFQLPGGASLVQNIGLLPQLQLINTRRQVMSNPLGGGRTSEWPGRPPQTFFLDRLGHVLADCALVRAESGGVAVEQPEQITL